MVGGSDQEEHDIEITTSSPAKSTDQRSVLTLGYQALPEWVGWPVISAGLGTQLKRPGNVHVGPDQAATNRSTAISPARPRA